MSCRTVNAECKGGHDYTFVYKHCFPLKHQRQHGPEQKTHLNWEDRLLRDPPWAVEVGGGGAGRKRDLSGQD